MKEKKSEITKLKIESLYKEGRIEDEHQSDINLIDKEIIPKKSEEETPVKESAKSSGLEDTDESKDLVSRSVEQSQSDS